MENEPFFVPGFFSSVYIWSVIYAKVDHGWSFANHRHPLFEIVYCESGSITEWINGQEYRLRAGDVLFLNSGAYHSGQSNEESVFFNFHFELEPRELRLLLQNIQNPVLSPGDKTWNRNVENGIKQLIAAFRDVIPQEDNFVNLMERLNRSISLLKVQTKFLQFIGDMVEGIMDEHAPIRGDIQPSQILIANEVAQQIETQGVEGMQICELAKKLNLHRNYITQCFTQVFGITPQNFLIQHRIKKAKQLLQESSLPIGEIAERMSFSSAAHFSHFFRSQTGRTPMQFRKGG